MESNRLAWLRWNALGYYGCPEPSTSVEATINTTGNPWLIWAIVLKQAKRGQFDLLPTLVPFCTQTADPVLARVCSAVLGDAGTETCLVSIVRELEMAQYYEVALNLCDALYSQGKLANIPLLLEAYLRFCRVGDVDIIPIWLADLIESNEDELVSEPHRFEDIEDYRDFVLDYYTLVVRELGTDQKVAHKGKEFGVIPFSKYMLTRIRQPYPRTTLRRKFEASTGIDCTPFYKDGALQPLAAAAIIEGFLNSTEADQYQNGARYFFGHRIPD
jgi:hypothetical protein